MICKQGTCHGRNWNSDTQQTLWIVKTVDVKFKSRHLAPLSPHGDLLVFSDPFGPSPYCPSTQKIDRKWQSLKKWIPKELSNKQKFTRDVNESIRDYVFAFVCRTNWGNANTLKTLADLASKCWVPKKACPKRVQYNLMMVPNRITN